MKKKRGAVALKQIKVIKKISENIRKGKKATLTQSKIDAGYSESYAKSGHLSETKTWKELMSVHLSDEKVARVHEELLESKDLRQLPFFYKLKDAQIKEIIESQGFKFISTKRFMTNAYVYFTVPDAMARSKALDLIYKLKSRYGDTTILHKFGELSDEDIERETARILAEAQGLADGEAEET